MAEKSVKSEDEFGTILEKLRKVQAAMRVCMRANQDARKRAWEWRDRRDELRGETPVVHDEIAKQRIARDELNVQVQLQKKLRDEETARAQVLQDKMRALRDEKSNRHDYIPLDELQRQFRELEWKQQTTSLSIDEERDLLEEMERLSQAIDRAPKTDNQDIEQTKEQDELWQEIQAARTKAQEHHETMIALVEEAQQKHQEIIQLSDNLGPAKTEADEAHQMYIQCLQEADEMRDRLDELRVEEIKLKTQLDTIRKTRKEARRAREKAVVDKLAEKARMKQQNGQKLTMEELRALMETNGLE
jgi:uncharacterized coiled-coil DUF342 family protein